MDDAALREAKKILRAKIRAIRDAIPPQERAAASAEIMQPVLDLMTPRMPKRIAFFAAIGAEADVTALADPLAEMGAEIYFPRVEGDEIRFRRASLAELTPGTWKIPEPPLTAPEAPSVDFMIVPGVAFDRACRRLGNGKGYYDRALARLAPAQTVGVCFAAQIVDEVPAGEHDRPLDVVVTERDVFVRSKH